MSENINFLQNGYNGEVLDELLTYAAQGNDTFKEGLIHIKAGIQRRYTLPSIQLGDIIQDNTPTPTSTHGEKGENGENSYTFTERILEPGEFMVYLEFNPRHYESYWRFAQPTGSLVFRELDPKVKKTMLQLLVDKKNEYVGNAIWTAAKGGEAEAGVLVPNGARAIGMGMEIFFDGVIKRVIDNVNATDEETIAGGQCIVSGASLLKTGEDVEKALYQMWKRCPKQIRRHSNLRFVMGWEAWDLYDQYLSTKDVKYSQNTEVNRYRFKGKHIIPVNGVPEHTILMGVFSTEMDSNLWMGVDYASDSDKIKVERLQANSELFFFQMRMKMDVNIVRPAELVIHTAYKKE